jgi:hypothetical protein
MNTGRIPKEMRQTLEHYVRTRDATLSDACHMRWTVKQAPCRLRTPAHEHTPHEAGDCSGAAQ